ncbi:interferon epsilon [Tenrec ecaudatus]|uniref:interferon epsilon n=1 Tax=Tenrec ecaudatus TaxID=94439 RepID=UPI003F5A5203
MMGKHFLEFVFLLLASSAIVSRELKPVHFQQRRVNRESLKLLGTLPRSLIRQCLPHRENFLLPWKAVNPPRSSREHSAAVLHEMLQQIFNLFRADRSRGSWDESLVEKFLVELHQQLERVETVMGLEADQKSHTLGTENIRLQVKMYFRRIHNYLENQKYSSCAWLLVRVEINRCLFFVFRLTEKLSN